MRLLRLLYYCGANDKLLNELYKWIQ
jgi:hypothetical protein